MDLVPTSELIKNIDVTFEVISQPNAQHSKLSHHKSEKSK